ncbi:hypothetical protein FACS189499_03780 [Clostridia bacterium]|nr:hypothetical protein FACS189499_03780 [Clostridia bacterium]
MKIKLTNVTEDTPDYLREDKPKLMSNTDASNTDASNTDASNTGTERVYNKWQKEFPEVIQVRLRIGTRKILSQKARELGFTGVPDLTRTALKYALAEPNFRKMKES